MTEFVDLEGFRAAVRAWCEEHVPTDWRATQTDASDEEFVSFQKAWFQELRGGGYAVPHWPKEWGAGMSVAEQIVLYQELAAHDAPRLVLPFLVEANASGSAGPADASIVKLYYSELLQRMMDFAADAAGLPGHVQLRRPMSSGWESGAWVLDFIASWEWTVPAGTSEIQRNIIGERGLGLPREPVAVGET